ncbi:MAG TPA: hypothetical protein VM123_05780 [archaeon]|nr:hypothetical protein [archaeon]
MKRSKGSVQIIPGVWRFSRRKARPLWVMCSLEEVIYQIKSRMPLRKIWRYPGSCMALE